MRLGDMNNLKAQALNEDMQKRVGWNFGDINRLSVNQASAMLENVDTKLSAIKKTKKIHESEKDTVYNGLVMAKQVLESYIAERAVSKSQQQAAGAALAAKKGDAPASKLKGASKAMAKMSTKELEKIAGTKHKGLPEKVTEGKRQSYVIIHGKHGESSVSASSTAEAKEKAMKKWKMTDTKGISAYPADGSHSESVNQTQKAVNESVEARLDEAYSRAEKMVDSAFHSMLDTIEPLMAKTKSNAVLANIVESIGGDSAWLKDANNALAVAYDALADAHRGALGHLDMDESQSQGMFEDEVGQAETIMASQDMVDSIQGMLEDVGQMINEKLPPLTDSIRRSNGADAAAAFNQQTNSALNALMDAVRAARESMASAVGTLSGEAPTPMTSVDTGVVDQPEVDMDLGADEELDDFAASDAATGGDEPLGRSKRA
jgi:hypothetical protein